MGGIYQALPPVGLAGELRTMRRVAGVTAARKGRKLKLEAKL